MVGMFQPVPQDTKDPAFWDRQRAIQRVLDARKREN
jgi:hypothetical protein